MSVGQSVGPSLSLSHFAFFAFLGIFKGWKFFFCSCPCPNHYCPYPNGVGEDFDGWVQSIDVVEVDGGIAERVVDEGDEAAASVTVTVSTEDGEVGDPGWRVGALIPGYTP